MSILISFAYLLLYIACVILVAFGLRWLIEGFMGWKIDADVEKWARVVVGLLCIIAVLIWLAGIFGMGPGLPHPVFR
jgi:hypothetical protein